MDCPNCRGVELTDLRVGGTGTHVCRICHGIWFTKNELEKFKDRIPDYEWFDVDLWEKKELMSAASSTSSCPVCTLGMFRVDWDNGKMIADICSECGGMWLSRGEYEKARDYIKDSADSEILNEYGKVIAHELEQALSGKHDSGDELRNLASLLRFFEYRFMVKHPLLTELIKELPFSS